jgi:hypothetical protein
MDQKDIIKAFKINKTAADALFDDYDRRLKLPVKNTRLRPTGLNKKSQLDLDICESIDGKSISKYIEKAKETSDIFYKPESGIEEYVRIAKDYSIALGLIARLPENIEKCKYGLTRLLVFRIVKLHEKAAQIKKDIDNVRIQLDKLIRGGEMSKAALHAEHAVIAASMASHAAARPGNAPLGGSRKKRRTKRRRTLKR